MKTKTYKNNKQMDKWKTGDAKMENRTNETWK